MVPLYFPVSLLLPWWQFPLRDALLNQGCAGQWKGDIFWRGKMYRIFLYFVICSGNMFFSCCCLFFFKMRGNKSRLIFMVWFTLLQFYFFLCLYIQRPRSDFFFFIIIYKQTIFLSKVSRIICVCSTGPRRFWFLLESAAVSYSDFVWPALLWQAGAGNNLSLSHQNIPL